MKLRRQKGQKKLKRWSKKKTVAAILTTLILCSTLTLFFVTKSSEDKEIKTQQLYRQAADAWRSRDIPALKKTVENMESSGLCDNNINCTFPKLLYAIDGNDKLNAPRLSSSFEEQKQQGQQLSDVFNGAKKSLGDINAKVKQIEDLPNDNLVPVPGTLEEPTLMGESE